MAVGKCCGNVFDCERNCVHRRRRAADLGHLFQEGSCINCGTKAANVFHGLGEARFDAPACLGVPAFKNVGGSDTDTFPAGDAKTTDVEHFGTLLSKATFAGGAKVAPEFSDTKPAYYDAGPDDLIAFALKHGIGAMEFTIMRYVMRWKQKQPLLSLRKAREYLDRLIAHAEAEELALKHGCVSSRSDTDA